MKKSICVVLTICILGGMMFSFALTTGADSVVWDGTVATDYAGGVGTQNSPYQIANGAQLACLAKQVNEGADTSGKYYKLTADIDLDNKPWVPIGTWENGFAGTFDGDGHIISNVTWDGITYGDVEDKASIGLFGVITATVTIKNLALVNVNVATKYGVAGCLAGHWRAKDIGAVATIENVFVKGNLDNSSATEAKEGFGGILARCGNLNSNDPQKLIIKNCVFDGTITGIKKYTYNVGGILGNLNGAILEMSDCLNIATIKDIRSYCGGMIGYCQKHTTVTRCVNLGTITNFGNQTGEICGVGNITGEINLNNCYGNINEIALAQKANSANTNTSEMKIDGVKVGDGTVKELTGDQAEATYNDKAIVNFVGLNPEGFPDSLTGTWKKRADDIAIPSGIANFDPKIYTPDVKYTVKFVVEGVEVQSTEYGRGEMPEYTGETPTKAEDDNYIYTFLSWNAELAAVIEDTTYTAEFYRTKKASQTTAPSDTPTTAVTTDQQPVVDTTNNSAVDSTTTDTNDDNNTPESKGCGGLSVTIAIMTVAMIAGSFIVIKKKH